MCIRDRCCVVPPPAAQLPDGIPTSLLQVGEVVVELLVGIVLYDFIFFLIHWGMHARGAAAHKRHHSMGELRARDVLEHSAVDGALQVLVNIMVQRHSLWGPKSRLARALHNIVVTWMLTESHTCAPTFYVWRRWLEGVRRHRAHHLQGAQYYQQFFGYLDNARATALD
eukprot:TRINITY_DN23990_c0_g1_i5.p1 TRINITY_DN23990_c0_g1~~TRINITY_DN23990_c0_g1_i5.p1  ORF type:complete len:183 (+),score=41.23 TRINITY_DN23990_c0_g1_i5:45-551(+)